MLLCSPHVFRKGLDSKPQLKRDELRRRQNVGVLAQMTSKHNPSNGRGRERGFTMAELLIAVAIIAVLVAIAVPVFSAQLKNSRLAVDHAAMRDAYALMQIANNTREVEIGGQVYSFEKLRQSALGSAELKNFYLTEDCSSFVFGDGRLGVPQGAYQFKETGCAEHGENVFCEACSQFGMFASIAHYEGSGIVMMYDKADDCIAFAI